MSVKRISDIFVIGFKSKKLKYIDIFGMLENIKYLLLIITIIRNVTFNTLCINYISSNNCNINI